MQTFGRLSLVLFMLVSLSACQTALLGAAGGAGYYVGKGKRKVQQVASDAYITSKINALYVKDDLVSAIDINVDTYEGVVTLYGNVADDDAEDRAVDLAEEVDGVKRVVNKLTVVDDGFF